MIPNRESIAMATECTQEAILTFLTERGGRVKNTDFMDHFKPVFPDDPEKKVAVREKFKSYVDNIAFVKIEGGIKLICLKKRYGCSVKCDEKQSGFAGDGASRPSTEPVSILGQETIPPAVRNTRSANTGPPETSHVDRPVDPPQTCAQEVRTSVNDVRVEASPGSGYGNDRRAKTPRVTFGTISPGYTREKTTPRRDDRPAFACSTVEVVARSAIGVDMGNCASSKGGKRAPKEVCVQATAEAIPVPDIPRIAVIEASPLPVATDESVFTLPEYQCGPIQTGMSGHVDTSVRLNPKHSVVRQTEGESVPGVPEGDDETKQSSGNVLTRRQNSRGSQRGVLSSHLSDDDEGQFDLHSLSGSEESNTPKDSRKNFIELMMNTSPQVRRSMVLRNSIYGCSRYRDLARSDSDSASVVSSNPDEDGAAVTLDPLEHEWMMCASDGEWESLHCLLTSEPNLILKKDFVTGFTCLHWAAKQGKPELLALIVNFAKEHTVPINVNARSSAGYTPLHLAAMHNHMEVVKLLVGAYDADVEIRDYSGKKACQYLTNSATVDIRDIIGAYVDSDLENADSRDVGRWRFSKVLHSNLKPLKLLSHNEGDLVDGAGRPREKLFRRKSSLSRMKPAFQRIRFRTSQIVQSTSFRDTEDLELSLRDSFKSRPKSSIFG